MAPFKDLEGHLKEICRHPMGISLMSADPRIRKNVWRAAKNFILWEGKMFRSSRGGLKTIATKSKRKDILKSFHDSVGHWDRHVTNQLISDRFWWPSMPRDTTNYVSTCDECQRMKSVPKYITTLHLPITALFDVFSMDFAGPFPTSGQSAPRYLLVCVEHLTNWPIVKATWNSTAETDLTFMKHDIFSYFDARKAIVSDNSSCFNARSLWEYVNKINTTWNTVLAYAPMSNRKAERMVGTMKQAIGWLALKRPED